MVETMKMCPICKQETKYMGTNCSHCNNSYAFVNSFMSEAAYQTWVKMIAAKSQERNDRVANNFLKNRITIENGAACIYNAGENSVAICNGNGFVQHIDNILQYCASVHHQVMLMVDGSLTVSGDCGYDMSELKNIKQVYTATGATYAIDNNGSVIVTGISPIQNQVCQWKDVKKLIGNRGRLVALTEMGNVLIADDTINDTQNLNANATNAVDIATSYNCTIWLNADGTIGFNGRASDPRSEVEKWNNIKSIAVENYYAVGLTTEGRVLLAGESISSLDLGRSEAATWENVIYVACSNSAIVGVFMDGTVKIVGNMAKKDAIEREIQQEIAKFFN